MSLKYSKENLNRKEYISPYYTPTSKNAKSKKENSVKPSSNVKSNLQCDKSFGQIESTTKKLSNLEIIPKRSPRVLEYKRQALRKLEMGYEKQVNKTMHESAIERYPASTTTPRESYKKEGSNLSVNEETYKKPYFANNNKTMEKAPLPQKINRDSKTRSKSKLNITNSKPPLYTKPRPSTGSNEKTNINSFQSVQNKNTSSSEKLFNKITSEKNIHDYSQTNNKTKLQNNRYQSKINNEFASKKQKLTNETEIYLNNPNLEKFSKTYDNNQYEKIEYSEKSNKDAMKRQQNTKNDYFRPYENDQNHNNPNQSDFEKLNYNDYYKLQNGNLFYQDILSTNGVKRNMNFDMPPTYEYPEISANYDQRIKVSNPPHFDVENDTQYKILPDNDSKQYQDSYSKNNNYNEKYSQDNLGNYAKNLSVELLDREEELLKEKIRELKETKRALRNKKRQMKSTVDRSLTFFDNLFRRKRKENLSTFFENLSHNNKKLQVLNNYAQELFCLNSKKKFFDMLKANRERSILSFKFMRNFCKLFKPILENKVHDNYKFFFNELKLTLEEKYAKTSTGLSSKKSKGLNKSNSFSVTKISMQSSLSNIIGDSSKNKIANMVNANSCLNFNNLQSSMYSKPRESKKNVDNLNSSLIEDKKNKLRKSTDGIRLRNKLESTPESIVFNKKTKEKVNSPISDISQKYEKSPFMKKKKYGSNNTKPETNKNTYTPTNDRLKTQKVKKTETMESFNKQKKLTEPKLPKNTETSKPKLKSVPQINKKIVTNIIETTIKNTDISSMPNSELPTFSGILGTSTNTQNDKLKDISSNIQVSSFSDEEIEVVSQLIRKFIFIKFSETYEHRQFAFAIDVNRIYTQIL